MNSQQPGDPCATGTDCVGSSHCDHNLCCASGACCSGTTANCPTNTDVCTTALSCTGTSTTYSCPTSGGTAYSCVASITGSTVCNGQVSNTCGNFKDAVCPTTTCLNVCSGDGDCDATSFCLNPGASGSCVSKYNDGTSCAASNQCKAGSTCGGSNQPYCPSPFTSCAGPTASVCCSGARCCNNGGAAANATQCGFYYTCDTPSACDGHRHVAACNAGTFNCDFSTPTAIVEANDIGCNHALNTSYEKPCPNNFAPVPCNGTFDQATLACPTKCAKAQASPRTCILDPTAPCLPGHTCSMGTWATCVSLCQ
jgi:hypothetical protein